jgi:hypothetical protein
MVQLTFAGVIALATELAAPSGGLRVAPNGSAFINTKQDCSVARYRWLTRRQLFGVGRLAVEGKRLKLSFDLHVAA